ncbi:MAG: hypothetical protein ACRD0U_12645 [Acidimicrobiales bacterium]
MASQIDAHGEPHTATPPFEDTAISVERMPLDVADILAQYRAGAGEVMADNMATPLGSVPLPVRRPLRRAAASPRPAPRTAPELQPGRPPGSGGQVGHRER